MSRSHGQKIGTHGKFLSQRILLGKIKELAFTVQMLLARLKLSKSRLHFKIKVTRLKNIGNHGKVFSQRILKWNIKALALIIEKLLARSYRITEWQAENNMPPDLRSIPPSSQYLIFSLVMKKTSTSQLHTFLHPYRHGAHPSNVSMFVPQVVELVCWITTSSSHRCPVIVWTATRYIKHPYALSAIAIVSFPLLQMNIDIRRASGTCR